MRTKNLLSLLFPIGVDEKDLDTVWLNTIDSFGSKRGETAHTTGVQKVIDPKDEHSTVKTIVDGIKALENVFSNLEKQIK